MKLLYVTEQILPLGVMFGYDVVRTKGFLSMHACTRVHAHIVIRIIFIILSFAILVVFN